MEFLSQYLNDHYSISSFSFSESSETQFEQTIEVSYLGQYQGFFSFNGALSKDRHDQLRSFLGPLFIKSQTLNLEKNLQVFKWVEEARLMFPELNDWTGVYFKESFITGEKEDTLILGPFIGAATEHTRIPLNQGLCGMALKEEKTVNVDDVHAHPEYLACSLETRSEIVIPLKSSQGIYIAELDIDSHTPGSYTPEREKSLEEFCKSFSELF